MLFKTFLVMVFIGVGVAVPTAAVQGPERVLMAVDAQSAKLEAKEELNAKADFYSDDIIHPLIVGMPRVNMKGTQLDRKEVIAGFFSTMFTDSASIMKCGDMERNDSTPHCSYIDFVLMMWAVGILLPLLTFFGVWFFCCGRCCCKCCCNNCGGKVPTTNYSGFQRCSALICYLVGIILLLGLSVGGYLITERVDGETVQFLAVMDDLLEVPGTFLEGFKSDITSLKNFSRVEFGKINDQVAGVAVLGLQFKVMKVQLTSLHKNLDDLKSNCAECADLRDAVGGIQTSVDKVDIAFLNNTFSLDKVEKSLDNATSPMIAKVESSQGDAKSKYKEILGDFGDQYEAQESIRSASTYALWGVVWIGILLSILAMLVRKPGCFVPPYLCWFLLLFLFFGLYAAAFMPAIIFGDFCAVLPAKTSPDTTMLEKVWGQIKGGDMTIGLFKNCLIDGTPGPNSNFFSALQLDKEKIFDDAFGDLDVNKTIPSDKANKALNTSSYKDPFDQLFPRLVNLDKNTMTYTDPATNTPKTFDSRDIDRCVTNIRGATGDNTLTRWTVKDVDMNTGCGGTACSTAVQQCQTTVIRMNDIETKTDQVHADARAVNVSMTHISITSSTLSSNISQMRNMTDSTVDALELQIVDAASCTFLSPHWNNFHAALCGNLSGSLDAYWFTCFAIALVMLLSLICNMKGAKRIAKARVVPRDATYGNKGKRGTGKRPAKGSKSSSGDGKKKRKKKAGKTRK